MRYETIGRCERCGKQGRYLERVDDVETADGFTYIAVCAYGCDSEHSKAQPAAAMVDKLLTLEIKQLKQELRKARVTPDEAIRQDTLKELQRRIIKYEEVQKYSAMGRMNVDDWSRMISLSNRWEHDTDRKISQRKAMRKTAKCLADLEQLEEDKRIYRELHRYAKGQCM